MNLGTVKRNRESNSITFIKNENPCQNGVSKNYFNFVNNTRLPMRMVVSKTISRNSGEKSNNQQVVGNESLEELELPELDHIFDRQVSPQSVIKDIKNSFKVQKKIQKAQNKLNNMDKLKNDKTKKKFLLENLVNTLQPTDSNESGGEDESGDSMSSAEYFSANEEFTYLEMKRELQIQSEEQPGVVESNGLEVIKICKGSNETFQYTKSFTWKSTTQ